MTVITPLQAIVNRLGQLVVQHGSNPSPKAHFDLLRMIDQLKLAVETPTETVLRLIYQPPQNAALRTVIDLEIFPLLVQKQYKEVGISATQLSEFTGADRDLIGMISTFSGMRLMRVMASLGLCTAPVPEVYQANEKTVALTQPIGRDGVPCIYDLTVPTLSKLPEYLRTHEYANPDDYARSPMQWAVGQSQFEWLASNKNQQTLFNSYMASRRQGKPMWFDVYPVERLLGHGVPCQDTVFLVDIGGNQGHDLSQFRQKHPHLPGRLVLQDLPKVVEDVSGSAAGIEVMGYSFLDPQPVKGARAYYFRAIFHDWPDHICQQILRNTMSAMASGYSRILIVDFVLPDTETPLLQASLDIQMMSIGAGVERSERQWRDLLHSVGLEITGIWNHSPGMESVIEVAPIAIVAAQ
ncbi:hypothetical protein N7462_009749 [Penicillium macrosclerotiorum]|uniref:uncharacterized protein n=1 Tax=Penicillium macrosclerotiorum TaxID=303699 RepID=UPI002547ED4A|nr:uncharacterized protein N7462_009749 [Penicillium macrosclerotiorum]KAJ5668679.1 hypothetical protein N7462_009749 [Penicillium macrosclerotiorum]